jgi:hypothetical protein
MRELWQRIALGGAIRIRTVFRWIAVRSGPNRQEYLRIAGLDVNRLLNESERRLGEVPQGPGEADSIRVESITGHG